jgi:TonB family protein
MTARIAWVICLLGIIPIAHADLEDELASRGFPDTRACRLNTDDIGPVLVVQFPDRGADGDNQQVSIEILKLMAVALVHERHFYVGFRPTEDWHRCSRGAPTILYWRDYEDNWRYLHESPAEYLKTLSRTLDAEHRGTAAEAYVLFSLGLLETRLDQMRQGTRKLEEAWELLDGNDPQGIAPFLLGPLARYHLEEGRDEEGQVYLEALAISLGDGHSDGKALPLVRVPPEYPHGALAARLEGTVVVEFTVTEYGKVKKPRVVEADPEGVFEEAALEAVLAFRYVPQVANGVPVETEGVRDRILFRLN